MGTIILKFLNTLISILKWNKKINKRKKRIRKHTYTLLAMIKTLNYLKKVNILKKKDVELLSTKGPCSGDMLIANGIMIGMVDAINIPVNFCWSPRQRRNYVAVHR